MTTSGYTVGELARLGGLTVRALHHYEKLGLLVPSARSDAGYRLYAPRDVQVLHRIVAYQQMGLALKGIAPLLGAGAPPLKDVIERQIAATEQALARQRRLLEMLHRAQRRAGASDDDDPAFADSLLRVIAFSRHYEDAFSDDELARLRAVQDAIGRDTLRRLEIEVRELTEAFRGFVARGKTATDPQVVQAGRRWAAIGQAMRVDGEPGEALRAKARAVAQRSPGMLQAAGLTPAMLALIDAAIEAATSKDAPPASTANAGKKRRKT